MYLRGESIRFWFPVLLLSGFSVYCGTKLVLAHIHPEQENLPRYEFERDLPARRGSVYSSYGKSYPLVKSVPYWEYRLDPVSLTNSFTRAKRRGEPPQTKEQILKTIATALKLDYKKLLKMSENSRNRFQYLAMSPDPEIHKTLADSTRVVGISIQDCQVRQYLHGRSLSHVLGAVNAEGVGTAGIELKYERLLAGTPGLIHGKRDARGRELYDKREISIEPIPGSDIYLTIDPNIQFEAETSLKWGLREYGAATGWCIVMDAATAAIYAMASYPDFDPTAYSKTSDAQKKNRAISFNYEPGSVMKVLTTATALDAKPKAYGPQTRYNTNQFDSRYYKLPGDHGHVWDPTMTLTEAIVHSSNIVIGKLAYDLGPYTVFSYFKGFGLGAKTGIELPGEEYGILPNPHKRMWDKASWSRAGIGQFVAVTPIQLVSAYQSIANNGQRMKPHVVSHIVDAGGLEIYRAEPKMIGRTIRAETARAIRKMMLGVAAPGGTAKRAAIRGYSVAGKTGTAQKQIPGGRGYFPGQYRGSFCGIVPASNPKLVILVTLDFDHKNYPYHQGGMSAGPVFKRVALAAIRYLGIQPDKPDELDEFTEDEFDKILDERTAR